MSARGPQGARLAGASASGAVCEQRGRSTCVAAQHEDHWAGRGEELLLADVDPAVLTASRRVNTHLTDRRPELYPTETPA